MKKTYQRPEARTINLAFGEGVMLVASDGSHSEKDDAMSQRNEGGWKSQLWADMEEE